MERSEIIRLVVAMISGYGILFFSMWIFRSKNKDKQVNVLNPTAPNSDGFKINVLNPKDLNTNIPEINNEPRTEQTNNSAPVSAGNI